MDSRNKNINLKDLYTINSVHATTWVPKDPQDIILPYSKDTTVEDRSDLDTRRQKAKEVVDGYTEIIEKCKEIGEVIAERCKNATVKLDRTRHLAVIQAIGRIFGIETDEITFEMYKICVQQLAKVTGSTPNPPGVK